MTETEKLIALVLELDAKATPGPWKPGVTYHASRDAEFIAFARTAAPKLARMLQKAIEQLKAPIAYQEREICLKELDAIAKEEA